MPTFTPRSILPAMTSYWSSPFRHNRRTFCPIGHSIFCGTAMTCQPTGGATAKYQTTTIYNRFKCLCAVSPFFRCLRLVAAAAIPLRFRCLLIAQQLRCDRADAKAALVLPIDGTTGPGGGHTARPARLCGRWEAKFETSPGPLCLSHFSVHWN